MTERERLTAAFAKLAEKNTFKPGDIVDWKPGMRNKQAYGPFIVVEVLDSPVLDNIDEAGSQYFREPLDIVLGKVVVDGGEMFIMHYYDSRRMEVIS